MPLWNVEKITEEPSITLGNWSIKECADGTAVVVGQRIDDGTGRVSTPIVTYDKEAGLVKTLSGRTYKLVGLSGYSSSGEYVWNHYKAMNNLKERDEKPGSNQSLQIK